MPVRTIFATAVVVIMMLTLCCVGAELHAQPQGGALGTNAGGAGGGANYDYSEEGGYNMTVNVWGFVGRPGKYFVPSATKLIDIISLAGGPTDRARLSDVQIVHDLAVDSTLTEPVVVYNMDTYKRTGDTLLNPMLYPNDTVIIPGDALNVFREIIGVISDVAVVVLSILGIYLTLAGN